MSRRSSPRDSGYIVSACRGLLAAAIVYVFVNALYALAALVGLYKGILVAAGTGILVGLVYEWLRRRRL